MNLKLFAISFGVVFLAELCDKTQLAALSLSASGGKGGILTVFLGASAALVCSTALACLCGTLLERFLNPKYLAIGSAVLFILLGVSSLAKLAWRSQDFQPAPTAQPQTPAAAVAEANPDTRA